MSQEIRADYSQVLMFPPSVEDWIGPEHPVRFIRDMVDSLDLKAMGFHVPDSGPGRPGYAADLMLKVWLYGYFHRIPSTRRLEAACREHMGLIWLTGMNVPDHTVLSRFMAANKEAIVQLFKQSALVAAKCKLLGMVVNAVDGTKIRATSSRAHMVPSYPTWGQRQEAGLGMNSAFVGVVTIAPVLTEKRAASARAGVKWR